VLGSIVLECDWSECARVGCTGRILSDKQAAASSTLGRSAHWCAEDGQIEAFVVVTTNLESRECKQGGMYESED
jgi:hypothetical protein